MQKKSMTPVCDFVREYQARDMLRLHMPGHKGRGAAEALDLTEIQGAEPLYSGRGILRESEERAAELFGAGRTVYSAEGSSLSIRAMLLLARMRAEREGLQPLILAGRNAHRAFLSGAAMLELEVAWLRGSSLLTCLPGAQELTEALDALPGPPAAVYLTSPDYLGFRADIPALAGVCHARGIPLLVDNAHGAYLRFLPEDQHPLSLGADMTCDSAHKTLPVLTGGGYLHIRRGADSLFVAQADRAMGLFASTSPSWLILQSLDRCNALLAGEYREKLAAFLPSVEAIRESLEKQGFSLAGKDPLRITLRAKRYGYTGNELHQRLREKRIECEFSDPDVLVMMLTPETGVNGLERLEAALRGIPGRDAIPGEPPAPPAPCPAMSLREAMLAPAEKVSLLDALGRVAADPCVSCPPAVPILVSGDRVTPEAIACLRYYGHDRVSVAASGGHKAGAQNRVE